MALGYRSLYGYGIPKSCENALQHYKFAADRVVQVHSEARPVHVFSVSAPVRLSDNAGKRHRPAHPQDDAQRVEYLRNRAVGSSDPQLLEKAAAIVLFSDVLSVSPMNEQHERVLEATAQLQRAANLGSFSAKALLGHVFAYGLGGTRDVTEAIRLYQEALNDSAAVNTTSAEAANGLGLVYLHGLAGTSVDYERAMQLFKLSARSGHADGVYNTGVLLSKANPRLARQYFDAAADVGHLKAQFELARLAEKEHFHNAKRSSDAAMACEDIVKRYKTVAENSDDGRELLQRAAERYFFANDREDALKLYLLAAEIGYEIAESNAAWLIERSQYQDTTQSASASQLYRELVLRGVSQDSADAYVRYGDLLFRAGDFALAVVQYELAISASHSKHGQALFSIGFMYEHGLGVPAQSREKAAEYYELAGSAEPVLKQVMYVLQLKLRVQAFVRSFVEQAVGGWRRTRRWISGEIARLRTEQGDAVVDLGPSSPDSLTLSLTPPLRDQGGSSVPDRVTFASALRFTRDSRLRVNARELLASQPLTVETWIHIERQATAVTTMVLLDLQDAFTLELARQSSSHDSYGTSAWVLQVRTVSVLFVFAEAPLADCEWHHIAVTIASDASSVGSELVLSLFVNGELKQRLSFHGHHRDVSAGPTPVLSIGSSLTRSTASSFAGSLMHVRIWSAAILSASTVRTLMTTQQHNVIGNANLAFEIHSDVRGGRSETRVGDTVSSLHASSDIFSSTAVDLEMVPFPPTSAYASKCKATEDDLM